jgi:hypothetical protein
MSKFNRSKLKPPLKGGFEIGGSAWESNPPETLLTPLTGFEVQEAHQDLTTSLNYFQ